MSYFLLVFFHYFTFPGYSFFSVSHEVCVFISYRERLPRGEKGQTKSQQIIRGTDSAILERSLSKCPQFANLWPQLPLYYAVYCLSSILKFSSQHFHLTLVQRWTEGHWRGIMGLLVPYDHCCRLLLHINRSSSSVIHRYPPLCCNSHPPSVTWVITFSCAAALILFHKLWSVLNHRAGCRFSPL